MKAEIVGKRMRTSVNKETGEVRDFNELHYVEFKEMRPNSKEEQCTGRKAGFIMTGIDLKNINVGEIYHLEFEVRKFREETTLRLADIEPLE